jgi:uncharacterized protein (TIGR03435 family)
MASFAGVPDGTGKMIRRKQSSGGGGNNEHPGRIHYQESLGLLLVRAYNVPRIQSKGPDWLSIMFVVDAIMPPNDQGTVADNASESVSGKVQAIAARETNWGN